MLYLKPFFHATANVQEALQLGRKASFELVSLFTSIVNESLRDPHHICLHPRAAVARGLLYTLAVRVVQVDSGVATSDMVRARHSILTSKQILRARVFSAMLITYCGPPKYHLTGSLTPVWYCRVC